MYGRWTRPEVFTRRPGPRRWPGRRDAALPPRGGPLTPTDQLPLDLLPRHPQRDRNSTGTVIRPLREASRLVDSLWRAAVAGGVLDEAMRLGEASHAIHRALVLLSETDRP